MVLLVLTFLIDFYLVDSIASFAKKCSATLIVSIWTKIDHSRHQKKRWRKTIVLLVLTILIDFYLVDSIVSFAKKKKCSATLIVSIWTKIDHSRRQKKRWRRSIVLIRGHGVFSRGVVDYFLNFFRGRRK